jgi:serine/threonine-protein kinase
VPPLLGLTEEQAIEAVATYDFDLDIDRIPRDGTQPGTIIETDPPAAERLKEGGTIKVLISLGNTPAPIPTNLAGATLDAAAAALLEAGQFVAVPTVVDDEAVPEGNVIRLGDGVPEQLPKGSEVPLVVSGGPTPRTVPNGLVGGTYEAAAAGLAGVQLKATKVDEFSDTIEAGKVIRLEPGQGQKAERDSAVKVIVSKGPDMVKVPDVSGKTVDQAVAAIEAQGLKAGDIHGQAGGKPFATDPPAGQSVRRGTTVDIFVRR